jgi:hypothetical protein
MADRVNGPVYENIKHGM